jgi:hypothetical protein
MWGFAPFELVRNPHVCRELALHPEAVLVALNIRAQMNGLQEHDRNIPWGYDDGPLRMRHEMTSRGVFHAVRLGLIEIVEPSTFADGKGRKARYRPSFKWSEYDPERPGRLLQACPYVSARWKSCFTTEGQWGPGWTDLGAQKRAPSPRRSNATLVGKAGKSGAGNEEDRADEHIPN